MATGLEDAWANLTLTAEEEEDVVVFEGGVPEEKAAEIAPSLVGSLHTEETFNVKMMKTVLCNIWKPARGLVIRELDRNLFVFQFFSMADRLSVLNEGPWSFDGRALLIREWTGLEQPSELEFPTIQFWVKAYDVPAALQTKTFAEYLGAKVGTFVNCEEETILGTDNSLCFRANVDANQPLRRIVKVILEGKPKKIKIRYVKLPDFCYGCGRLGHALRACDIVDPETPSEKLLFGPWMRASPLKSRRRIAEAEVQEEQRLFLTIRGGNSNPKARFKLNFENKPSSAAMIVDKDEVCELGNEVFKQKLDREKEGPSGAVKFRVVEDDAIVDKASRKAEVAQ